MAQNQSTASLWLLIETCFTHLSGADKRPSVTNNAIMNTQIKSRVGEELLGRQIVEYSIMRLTKMMEQEQFDSEDSSSSSSNDNDDDDGDKPTMECEVCCCDVDYSDGLFCNSSTEKQHWACR